MSEYRVTSLPYREDPRPYYEQIRALPWPVWLDSGFPLSGAGRYDIISADPYATLTVSGTQGVWRSGRGAEAFAAEDALDRLRDELGEPAPSPHELPFGGGAIGFLAYDWARALGPLPERLGLPGCPQMAIGLYDWGLVVDHARRRAYFVSSGRDPRPSQSRDEALRLLQSAPSFAQPAESVSGTLVEPGLSPEDYAERFGRVQEYILAGDCYQVNLAHRFVAQTDHDAWNLYQRMRTENPAPFGALLEYPFGQIMSSSPERFVQLTDGLVETKPIKGTRPRGETAEQDLALRAGLVNSPKDRAENLMIVDLLRNDLGQVCQPGTIQVPGLFEIESFATVHHLVSTVTGTLREGYDATDLLAACFPGGSITGAPKLRAMQIIDELEPHRREVYCGNVIRIGFDGSLDSNIMIRTALLQGDSMYYWAGGGIVADSDCAAEYRESLDKAAAFFRLLQIDMR